MDERDIVQRDHWNSPKIHVLCILFIFIIFSISAGITFETDWGEENIVVKALQSGSFAAKETDIQIGDVLLMIDEEQVRLGHLFVVYSVYV